MDLFSNIKINKVDLKDLNRFQSTKEFRTFGKKIEYKEMSTLLEYYNQMFNKEPYLMMYSPLYNTLSKGNKSYYFMTVEMDNDEILLLYKVTNIYTSSFVKIYNIPISKNGNEENVTNVLKILYDKSFIRFVYNIRYEEYLNKSEGTLSDNITDYDYFFEVEKQINKFSTKKFRTDYKINRYETDNRFNVNVTNTLSDKNKKDILWLRENWLKKMKNNYPIEKDYEFVNVLNSDNKNVWWILIYCDNMLLSVETFEIWHDNILLWFVTHIGRNKEIIEDSYVRASVSEIRFTSLYFLLKWCKQRNINRIYYEGAEPHNTKLAQYKMNVTDGYIQYRTLILENKNGIE